MRVGNENIAEIVHQCYHLIYARFSVPQSKRGEAARCIHFQSAGTIVIAKCYTLFQWSKAEKKTKLIRVKWLNDFFLIWVHHKHVSSIYSHWFETNNIMDGSWFNKITQLRLSQIINWDIYSGLIAFYVGVAYIPTGILRRCRWHHLVLHWLHRLWLTTYVV